MTPPELYDISQMKLIAIVKEKDDAYALIGLPDGKFYTIRRGMLIGIRSGVVKDITSATIVIMEMRRDFKGKVKLHDVYLRLRKEGVK